MNLTTAHRHDLLSIGLRGLATLAAVLLFWGTTAPTIFHEHDIYVLSRYAGISAMVVLTGGSSSSYWNLITPGLTKKERRMGYILFWFSGSLFASLVWQLPYLIFPNIATTQNGSRGFWWKILWWFYTLQDSWYADHSVPVAAAFELGWLLASFLGAYGLYIYFGSQQQRQFTKSLLLFCVCGALQSSTILLYLCFCLYVARFENVQNDWMSYMVFFGINGFRVSAPAIASYFSGLLLLCNMDSNPRRLVSRVSID